MHRFNLYISGANSNNARSNQFRSSVHIAHRSFIMPEKHGVWMFFGAYNILLVLFLSNFFGC